MLCQKDQSLFVRNRHKTCWRFVLSMEKIEWWLCIPNSQSQHMRNISMRFTYLFLYTSVTWADFLYHYLEKWKLLWKKHMNFQIDDDEWCKYLACITRIKTYPANFSNTLFACRISRINNDLCYAVTNLWSTLNRTNSILAKGTNFSGKLKG